MARITVDEIVTKYTLDPSGFTAGAAKATSATKQLGGAVKNSIQSLSGLASGAGLVDAALTGLGSAAQSLIASLAKAGAAGGVLAAALGGVILAAVGAAAAVGLVGLAGLGGFKEFAGLEALELSLASIEGSAARAKSKMEELRDIAKAPGATLEESIRGYNKLRGSGMSEVMSGEFIRQLSNVNARAGGGRDEFSRLLTNFAQMQSADYLQGDELTQISEAGLFSARSDIRKRFGTADTEKLKSMGVTSKMVLDALLESMAALPRVSGGAKNAIENLEDSLKQLKADAGKGAAETLAPLLNSIGSVVAKTAELGTAATIFGDFFDNLLGGVDVAESFESIVVNVGAVVMTIGQLIGQVRAVLANIMDGLRKIPGIKELIPDLVFGGAADAFRINRDTLQAQFDNAQTLLDQKARQRKEKEVEDKVKLAKELADRANADASEAKKPAPDDKLETVPILRQIKENTDPLRQIADQILGGGALAKSAASRSNLSALGGGGGMHPNVRRVAEELVRSIQFNMMLQPGGSRREVT